MRRAIMRKKSRRLMIHASFAGGGLSCRRFRPTLALFCEVSKVLISSANPGTDHTPRAANVVSFAN
jgi:hypothetical protein